MEIIKIKNNQYLFNIIIAILYIYIWLENNTENNNRIILIISFNFYKMTIIYNTTNQLNICIFSKFLLCVIF